MKKIVIVRCNQKFAESFKIWFDNGKFYIIIMLVTWNKEFSETNYDSYLKQEIFLKNDNNFVSKQGIFEKIHHCHF